MLKVALIAALFLPPFSAVAGDMTSCNGTVLQRRVALVQFGQLVDAYIATQGELPDICSAPVDGLANGIPDLLRGASICGSSNEGFVYYSCVIPVAPPTSSFENSPVIESCRYSLINHSVSCENRFLMTTFEEAGNR